MHPDGAMCETRRAVWVPPARSLHVRPATLADDPEGRGGLVATCDCGTVTLLTFAPCDPSTGREWPPGTPGTIPSQGGAYTCDGCGSAHWLTLIASTGE